MLNEIELVEADACYADDIWVFRDEILTNDEKNVAGEKVILENGGIYEKTLLVDGSNIKRYWIVAK